MTSRRERRLDAELRHHLDLQVAEYIRSGMTPAEARRQAALEFGPLDAVKDDCRDARPRQWLARFGQDLRYARRTLFRSRGFTAVVLVSLALGLGANAAIFSLVDAIVLRGLPVARPHELFFIERGTADTPGVGAAGFRKFSGISYPMLRMFAEREPAIVDAAAFRSRGELATVAGERKLLRLFDVDDRFFPLLGVKAAEGRLLAEGDAEAGGAAVASHAFARTYFPHGALGGIVLIGPRAYTIVGVTEPRFTGMTVTGAFDLALPYPSAQLLATQTSPADPREPQLFDPLVRLRPGSDPAAVGRSLTQLLTQVAAADGVTFEGGPSALAISALSARQGRNAARRRVDTTLVLLSALAVIVLLVTCVNIANLQLARLASRIREMAIRASLGAGRRRLIAQLMTENAVLACAGGLLALPVAALAQAGLSRIVTAGGSAALLPGPVFDARLIAFVALTSALTSVLFGVIPAIRSTRSAGASVYARTSRSRATRSVGHALVAAQVALCTVLLVGGGLFVRSLRNLTMLDSGYARDHVLSVAIDPQMAGLGGARVASIYARILERVWSLPGVTSATLERNLPLSGAGSLGSLAPPGYLPPPGTDGPITWFEEVGPRYFETFGIRIVEGRDFTLRDDASAPKVLAINEAAARLYFPGTSPLGHTLADDGRGNFRIVAVVADVRHQNLRKPGLPMAYLPTLQDPRIRNTSIHLRTTTDPLAFAPAVRGIIRDVDPIVPVLTVTTLEDQAARSLVEDRLTASLGAAFGTLALVLAGVGLGGVLWFAVARRTREIGVRMALGARRSAVARMVLGEALRVVAAGIAIGLPIAIAAGRYVRTLLFELTPADPLTLAATAAALTLVAAVAAWWPALRAASVDPLAVLKTD